ncbi:ATP-binding protein [Chroococcidiopsis cubana]|uniref:ATP-binding protein n=1 Tax=Chroococcidiopsis cubana TaxID=171392 RepID=UPI002ACDA6B9|nr:ATP-binding protein [Chroococcidiopsis cubana]
MRQVLINLLGNAIKFTQAGGAILRVRTKQDKQEVSQSPPTTCTLHFEVEDTGPGIAASELERLFKPFVQTEAGRKSHEGTGLGLTISQQFVRLMGGEIAVSTTLGHGTIF